MKILYITLLFYMTSSFFYLTYLWSQNKKLVNYGYYMGIAGLFFHSLNLFILIASENKLDTNTVNILFLFSWLIAVVYFISQIKFKAIILGAFILPIIFLLCIPSLIIPPGLIDSSTSLSNFWVLIHITLIFLGEAFFVISFIAGLLYIFQENRIKSKHLSRFLKKLPSLTTLDRINHFSLLLGFPFLTIGLAIGFILAKEIYATEWVWGGKETLSSATWLFYALLINGRFSSGWKGRNAALGAVLGFIVILGIFTVSYVFPLGN